MAVDKNKVTADATRLVQKGQLEKAIRAYEKILAEDPKDVRVLLKVGELHQKRGDARSAAGAFGRAADAYAEQGFFLKSVAVYKQIMKLAPEDARVNERLAGLYQQLGILSEAMTQLQLVAAAAERGGDTVKLLEVLRRMLELEPENVGSLVKIGELYARADQPRLALEHLRSAAEHLKRNNRTDEYLRVAERIGSLPGGDDLALTRELANIYLAKGDTKRALSKLQACFKADPKDLETLTLLAQAFKDLGQSGKTVSVYKELAHVLVEKGRAGDALATWRRVAEIAPDDAEARDALRAAAAPRPPPPGPVPAPRAPAPGPPPGARAAAPPVPSASGVLVPPSASPPPLPPRAAAAESVPKLLTETDVYVKYGLHDKALEHLERIFAVDPDHLEAREKRLQLLASRPDAAPAAQEAIRVVRIALARGLEERARAGVARLRELAPAHPQLAELARAANAAEPAPPAPGDVGPADVQEVDFADVTPLAEGDEPPVEVEVEVEVEVDEPAPAGGARTVEARPGEAAGAQPPGDEEVDLDDELAEAEFLVQQHLLSDARESLQGLLAFHPGHRKVAAALADLERREASRAAAQGDPAPAAAPDAGFDIGKELADELAGAPAPPVDDFQFSVEDVFTQFKRGVEQTVRAEDSDTHYDLGIAYKEMGLLDDALHELEVALAGGNRRKEIDCLTMMALLHREKGDRAGAVEAYRRALRSEALTPDAARAIHYELALEHEALGQPEVALHYLQQVLLADPRYRDASAMAARLGGGAGRPPSDGGAQPASARAGGPGGA